MKRQTKKIVNRKNYILYTGIVLSAVIVLATIFAPFLEPYDPTKMELSRKFIAPCREFIFGTDHLGRDIFSRVIEGARVSLSIAAIVVFFSAVLGVALGMFSGYAGGTTDMLIMRVADVLLAFPAIIFALALSTMMGTGRTNLIIAITCIQWTRYARIARGETLMLKNAEYVEAAKSIGNNTVQILGKYIFPNVISKIIILASLDIGTIILYCASLSFLGLGAQPPSPDWGVMISEGKDYMQYAPWLTLFPGLAIAFSALSFNMLGDGLRDLLDPRMKEVVRTD